MKATVKSNCYCSIKGKIHIGVESMSKYSPLFTYLKNHDGNHVKLTFDQIETIISDKLPKSASKYREFWSNGGHSHAGAWMDANWKVEHVVLGEYIEFEK
jgi:hypothetical protein